MQILFHPEPMAYDGTAIRSHWARKRFGLAGDAAVAFLGACGVAPGEVVDMEEVISGAAIRGERMAHFVVEHFGPGLEGAVLRLYLLAARAFVRLAPHAGPSLILRGSDLYLGEGKLSVGVATVTPVSAKVHFGVNVTTAGVPVKAAGLEDLGVDARAFAEGLLGDYAAAMAGVEADRCKVRGAD